MAALTDGTVQLHGVLFSDDSRYFISSLQSLGFDTQVNEKERSVTVTGLRREDPEEGSTDLRGKRRDSRQIFNGDARHVRWQLRDRRI